MYREGTEQYEHHVKTYGPPSEFGYKDFIPMFKAEIFDPEQWVDPTITRKMRLGHLQAQVSELSQTSDGVSFWTAG
jgi:hypothetical protein